MSACDKILDQFPFVEAAYNKWAEKYSSALLRRGQYNGIYVQVCRGEMVFAYKFDFVKDDGEMYHWINEEGFESRTLTPEMQADLRRQRYTIRKMGDVLNYLFIEEPSFY